MRSKFGGFEANLFEGVGGSVFEGMSGNMFEGHRGFNDLFGMGQTAPAGYMYIKDPYYVANQRMTADAKAALAAFAQNRAKIAFLPLQAQKDAAMAIVKKNWYGKGILGLTGSNLDVLAPDIQTYANEGIFQQYNIEPSGAVYQSDTRAKKLKAFSDGSRELYRYMVQFLPTQVIEKLITSETGLSAVNLIGKATQAAAIARSSRSVNDAAEARAYALAAIEAGRADGNPTIETEGQMIADEMAAIIQAGGAPVAPVSSATGAAIPWGTIGLIGGGAVALIVLAIILTRK